MNELLKKELYFKIKNLHTCAFSIVYTIHTFFRQPLKLSRTREPGRLAVSGLPARYSTLLDNIVKLPVTVPVRWKVSSTAILICMSNQTNGSYIHLLLILNITIFIHIFYYIINSDVISSFSMRQRSNSEVNNWKRKFQN